MKIVYQDNALGLRGTAVALYDYAYFNREYNNIEPVIVYGKHSSDNNEKVIKKFTDAFGVDSVHSYDNINEMKSIIDLAKADAFYSMKAGADDGIISTSCKNLIHAVFQVKQPHGDVYAYISEWLSNKMGGDYPFVPYMVHLPVVDDNYRSFLNIPSDAFVIGRHGGYDTFDIDFAKRAIINTIEKRKDLYYVFVNTIPFFKHERIRYIDNIAALDGKSKFINTCDAMIHARSGGESFGLAIAEFSLKNKPVICFNGGVDLNHVEMLKNVGVFYNHISELENILINFIPDSSVNYDVVSDKFSPKIVCDNFFEVFLK